MESRGGEERDGVERRGEGWRVGEEEKRGLERKGERDGE